jgi:hypothetical protein
VTTRGILKPLMDASRAMEELRGALDRLVDAIERDGEKDDEPLVEDYDPGPEVDDEGGMSEHRHEVYDENYNGPWSGED